MLTTKHMTMSGSSLFPPTHERGLSENRRNLTVPVAHNYSPHNSHRNSHHNSHDKSTCHTCYLSTAHPVRRGMQMRELPRLRRCDGSIALHISIYHAAGFLPGFAKYRSRCPFIACPMPYKLSSVKWPPGVRRPQFVTRSELQAVRGVCREHWQRKSSPKSLGRTSRTRSPYDSQALSMRG